MLDLEFNWGRWNGDDVKGLDKHISTVIPRLGMFLPVYQGILITIYMQRPFRALLSCWGQL